MKASARRPLDFSLTEPPAVLAAAQGAVVALLPAQTQATTVEALKQLNTRIPVSKHRAFKMSALAEGVSVQDLLARLIDRHLADITAKS